MSTKQKGDSSSLLLIIHLITIVNEVKNSGQSNCGAVCLIVAFSVSSISRHNIAARCKRALFSEMTEIL